MKNITIELSDSLYRKLVLIKADTGMTFREIAEISITRYLEELEEEENKFTLQD